MTIPDTIKGSIYQNDNFLNEKKTDYLNSHHHKEASTSNTSSSSNNINNTNNSTATSSSTSSSTNTSNSNYYNKTNAMPYEIVRQVGQGTFGKVYEAKNHEGRRVAIKKVEKSNHFISREYDILKVVNHPNCLKILDMFYTSEDNKRMQNLVFDFIPYTLASLLKKRQLSLNFIKVLFYQLCQAIKHIHTKNICHRDITPNNILLNQKGELILADFGSAKILEVNHASMSYICSRYYRAPELLVGCASYSTKIDIWSIGCILAEMLIGKPLFPGSNSNDQLGRIIEVLGTPTQEDMEAMKPSKTYVLQLPTITPKFNDTLNNVEDKEVINLLSKIFVFDPTKRASIDEIIAHPFLQGVSTASLDQYDEMKCFTKPVTSSSSNNTSSAAAASVSTSSSAALNSLQNTTNNISLNSSNNNTRTINITTTNTNPSSNNNIEKESHILTRLNPSVITSSNNLKTSNISTNSINSISSLNNSNNGVVTINTT
eukprot:gene2242-2764_t